MLETIQQIKDLANVTENLYLLHKITLLEQQINNQLNN